MPKRPIDPDTGVDLQLINIATHQATQRAVKLQQNLARYLVDPDRGKRQEQQRCRACYYLAEPALKLKDGVYRACEYCKAPVHYDWAPPCRVCISCGPKLDLCLDCGADMELQIRTGNSRSRRGYGSKASQ